MGCLASAQRHRIPDSEAFFQKYALGRKIGEGPWDWQKHPFPQSKQKQLSLEKKTDTGKILTSILCVHSSDSSLWPGAFGQVRIATDLKSGQSYAVKVADVRAKSADPDQTPISSKRQKSIEREIEMWTLASGGVDPHITRLFASWPFFGGGYL